MRSLYRSDAFQPRPARAARARLERFAATGQEVQPSDPIRAGARRLLRVHTLRAADALPLAAAIAAAEGRPESLAFVCLDDRLAAAAERESFTVLGMPDRG